MAVTRLPITKKYLTPSDEGFVHTNSLSQGTISDQTMEIGLQVIELGEKLVFDYFNIIDTTINLFL